jgi:hypothetical protein
MFLIIKSKETSHAAVITELKRNEWSNLENTKREDFMHLRNKKREYLEEKNHKFAKNNDKKIIRDLHRGINEFKRA